MASYQLDASHSSAAFRVRHMMISYVRGEFRAVRGSLEYDPAHPESSKLEAEMDVTSIDTGNQQRDDHLRSADFFNAQEFPRITFKSTGVKAVRGSSVDLHGELTIRGTTKPVVFRADMPSPESKDPFGNVRIGSSATGSILRSDFGMVWNSAIEAGGVLVGDEVKIELEASFIRS